MTSAPERSERFSAELRRLYLAAGSPSYRSLTMLAERQKPPVRLGVSTLSDWLKGRSIPSDPRPARFLVEALQSRAMSTPPGPGVVPYQPRPWPEWERMRREAAEARRALIAAGPAALDSPARDPGIPGAEVSEAPVTVAPVADSVAAPGGLLDRLRDWAFRRPGIALSAVIALTAVVTAAATSTLVTTVAPGARGVWSNEPAPPVLDAPSILDVHHRPAGITPPTNPNRFWIARDVSGLAACPQDGRASTSAATSIGRPVGWRSPRTRTCPTTSCRPTMTRSSPWPTR